MGQSSNNRIVLCIQNHEKPNAGYWQWWLVNICEMKVGKSVSMGIKKVDNMIVSN